MYTFLVKRSFWNYLDTMLPAVLVNLLLFVVSMGTGFAYTYTPEFPWKDPVFAAFYLAFFSHYLLIAGLYAQSANSRIPFGLKEISRFFRKGWIRSLQLFVSLCIITAIGYVSLPFYITLGGVAGAIGAAVISWILLLSVLSLLFLCPLLVRNGGGFVASLRRSFFWAINNPLVTLLSALLVLLQLAFSALFLFILPGLSAVLLLSETLVSLMEKKYGWLAAGHHDNSEKIPWNDLLKKESEDFNRSLIDTLFPFKRK